MNKELIMQLESYLELAKSEEIKAFVIGVVHKNGGTSTSTSGSVVDIFGVMELVKHHVYTQLDKNNGEKK